MDPIEYQRKQIETLRRELGEHEANYARKASPFLFQAISTKKQHLEGLEKHLANLLLIEEIKGLTGTEQNKRAMFYHENGDTERESLCLSYPGTDVIFTPSIVSQEEIYKYLALGWVSGRAGPQVGSGLYALYDPSSNKRCYVPFFDSKKCWKDIKGDVYVNYFDVLMSLKRHAPSFTGSIPNTPLLFTEWMKIMFGGLEPPRTFPSITIGSLTRGHPWLSYIELIRNGFEMIKNINETRQIVRQEVKSILSSGVAKNSSKSIPLSSNLVYGHINPPILPENNWNTPGIPLTANIASAGAGIPLTANIASAGAGIPLTANIASAGAGKRARRTRKQRKYRFSS